MPNESDAESWDNTSNRCLAQCGEERDGVRCKKQCCSPNEGNAGIEHRCIDHTVHPSHTLRSSGGHQAEDNRNRGNVSADYNRTGPTGAYGLPNAGAPVPPPVPPEARACPAVVRWDDSPECETNLPMLRDMTSAIESARNNPNNGCRDLALAVWHAIASRLLAAGVKAQGAIHHTADHIPKRERYTGTPGVGGSAASAIAGAPAYVDQLLSAPSPSAGLVSCDGRGRIRFTLPDGRLAIERCPHCRAYGLVPEAVANTLALEHAIDELRKTVNRHCGLPEDHGK